MPGFVAAAMNDVLCELPISIANAMMGYISLVGEASRSCSRLEPSHARFIVPFGVTFFCRSPSVE